MSVIYQWRCSGRAGEIRGYVCFQETVCERADRMHPADGHLLVLLRAERKDTFNTIAEQLPPTHDRVGERCRRLAAYGLVEHLGSDIYAISPLEERYLDGEVDASDLNPRGVTDIRDRIVSARG